MYRILTASKDTYITNKIINNEFRATDANVGKAASLDLFKLYAESTSGSNSSPTEISRLLVKFDLDPIRRLTGSILDLDDSSFSCTLSLTDVYGGQTCPSNFNIILFPLSRSFDEGVGMDVVTFADLDSCNFLTASVLSSSPTVWTKEGANKQGFLGSSNIDIVSSGTLSGSAGTVNLWKSQTFKTGRENLSMDITTIVSATLKGLIPDHGFRLSYSGSEETDSQTRFVKRFGSRNNTSFFNRPKIIVKFNDAIQDKHGSSYFGLSGSLFLNNFHQGVPSNILSGASRTPITESNSLLLILESGSTGQGTYFKKIVTASQHSIGTMFVSGVYSASFALSEYSASNKGETRMKISGGGAWSIDTLENEIRNAGSATFTEVWSSMDGTVGYHTGSLVMNTVRRTSFENALKRLVVSITNMKSEFRIDDKYRFRVFVEDIDRPIKAKKVPLVTPSSIFTKMYYEIKDVESGKVLIPFDTSKNSTLLSTDSDGMYFDLYMDSLFKGSTFTINFLIKDEGVDQLFTDVAAKFRVV